MAKKILITGARAAAALDIARDFARAGYEVHMADCAPARISRWSKAVTEFHHYPSPVWQPAAFAKAIVALSHALKPVLIVPSCEEAFHLASPGLKEEIGDQLFQPPLAILRRLHDKGTFAELCSELGLPVPETRLIGENINSGKDFHDSQDWVFKPCFSRFGEDSFIGPNAKTLASIRITPDRPWIAQRRIRGHEYSFYAVARNGKVTAFAAYAARWRLSSGASISFDPVDPAISSDMFAIAEALAEACNLNGQFACDFMVDASGQGWVIECNPRATSGTHLLSHSGHLADAMVGTVDVPALAKDRSYHLLPAMLFYGLGQAARNGGIMEWLIQLKRGQDVAGKAGDRLPALGAIIDGLGFMLSGLSHGQSAIAATTADIEWNGSELS